MSTYLISYQQRTKVMRPVSSAAEYLQLRGSETQKNLVTAVRNGDTAKKRRLLQFNYSCIPGEDGKLKGCSQISSSVGMDIDHLSTTEMENVKTRILEKKDELGLLMLERSVRCEGYHIVFRRKPELSQEENLRWASNLLGVEYDKAAKDITRVFYAITADPEDLLFLDDELFRLSPCPSHKEKGVETPTNQSPEGEGEGVDSLPYGKILPAFFQMECPTYPDVPEGTRNDTLFNVTAKYLRYCTDHNFDRIKSLLYPKYAFGLDEAEMDSIIRSALSRERSYTPKAVKHILNKYSISNPLPKGGGVVEGRGEALDDGSPYRPLELCILDEVSMPQLPRWVNTLLKVSPPGYRFITLAATAPAMMVLATDVSVKFGKKRETRLNAWTHIDGPMATHKSICLSPIPVLLKPLQDEDDRNLARESEYFQKKELAVNKKEQPTPPKDIVVRVLPANTTRLQHIKRMADAKGKHTYTYCEEIMSLNLNTGSQYSNRSDFMQLLFDNGMTGNQSFVQSSIRVNCPVCWNLTTSGTRDQTLRTFKNATNGAITRVFFCLVPDAVAAPLPDLVQYTDADKAYIERAAKIMMQLNGMVLSPKIDKALVDWLEKTRLASLNDRERLTLKNRSADIAHRFGVVMHLAWITQHIMDVEDREGRTIEVRDLDLSQYNERQSIVDLAVYAADQCLDGQYRIWAKRMKQQAEAAYYDTGVYKKSDAEYFELPETFTYSVLEEMFPKKRASTLRKMVERLKTSNKICCIGADAETGEKRFKKTVV